LAINSAAIYGGDNYKNYYGYVDFAEKGCAKKCMSQLMSSEEEMKFLNVGEKSLHTYLRYKWKMTEDNPELNGIVTRDYKPITIANNNYVTAVTTVAIPSSTPNVLAPPFIPATYTTPHGLSNRRSGNLTLENPKIVATTTKGLNGAYYPITTIANANPATPAIGGIMPMGMNMNMNMGMTIGIGMNRNGSAVNVNPKMAYSNNMYNPNWQNSGRVSNGGRNRSRGNSASNGNGNNGLNHRSSNRSMRSNNGNSNTNENINDHSNNSPSSTTNTTTSSKGMDVTAKEFVMPSKKSSQCHLHVENIYYDKDQHKAHDNNDVKEGEEAGKEKEEKVTKVANKPNNDDLTHGGEEDTIVEEKQSVKEDNTEDITEIVSNANEDTTTATTVNHQDIDEEEGEEPKEEQGEEQEEEKINSIEEDIISSLEHNSETKWGDMKDSSALPPLNDLPNASSTNGDDVDDNDDKATEDTNNENSKNNSNSSDNNNNNNNNNNSSSSSSSNGNDNNKNNNTTANTHRNKYNSSSSNNTYNNKYNNATNNTYHNKYNNNTTGNVYNNNPNGNVYSNNAYNYTNGTTYNSPYNNPYNNIPGNTYNSYNHYNNNGNNSNNNNNSKRLSNTSSAPSISSDEEELLGPLPEFVSQPLTRTKLNISRIPPGMTYDQLYSLFLEHGQILSMTIKPAKIGTVAFLEYATPEEAMEAIRELDDAYAVDEATPIHQIPQNLESLCVDYAYSDGITRHSREGVTPIFIKGLPGNMKRGDLKIICVEFGDLAKTRLSKMDGGAHGIKCSATIEYVRKSCTRMALAYLEDLFHKYGYHTVKVEKYNTNRNSYKPPHS
jgi:hypothetical protein